MAGLPGGRRAAAAAAVLAVSVSGCTSVVGGTVRPAPGLTPQPVTGVLLKQVLLDDAELSGLLGQRFRSDPTIAPRFGGSEQLPDGWDGATPADCVGTAVGTQKSVYETLGVRDVAHEYWVGPGPVTGAAEGVVALAGAADADAAFEKFAEQWRRCADSTVTRYRGGKPNAAAKIIEVDTDGSVLTATVRTGLAEAPGSVLVRALGVRLNCLVDVDVFISADRAAGAATDIARAMMDRVSALAP